MQPCADTPVPTPNGRGFRPLTGVSLAQLGGGFAGGANSAYIVVLAVHLDVSPGSLGWIASAFGFALLAVSLVGRYLLRFGAERLLRVAAALGVVAAAVLALMPGYPLLIPAALAGGLSGAAMLLSSATLLRGEASRMSLITGFASLASLSAPPAIGIFELAGLPGGWALLLPIPFLLVVALRGVRRPVPAADAPSPVEVAAAPSTAPGPRPVAVVAAWSAIVLAVAAEFCFFTWGVARLVDSGLGIGPAAIAGVAFPLGMVIGRFAGARLPVAGASVLRQRLRLAAAVTAVATVAVVIGPWQVTAAGLLVAGLALSTTYANSLSLLVGVPGLALRSATSLGVAASGVAISAAPLALAAVAGATDLRIAFLLPLPLLAMLVVAVHPRWATQPTYLPPEPPADLPAPRGPVPAPADA